MACTHTEQGPATIGETTLISMQSLFVHWRTVQPTPAPLHNTTGYLQHKYNDNARCFSKITDSFYFWDSEDLGSPVSASIWTPDKSPAGSIL